MTEKITLELTLEELKLIDKYVEFDCDTKSIIKKIKDAYPKPKMHLENEGDFSIVSYDGGIYYRLQFPIEVVWYRKTMVDWTLGHIDDVKTKNELESAYLQSTTYCPDEPEYDEVEWDEKDNPPNLQKIIDKMIEERKSQKLWCMISDKLGYTDDACDKIVDLVESWIPKEQDASGSQNVNTELLVEGFNDAIRKMKEMLS